MAIVKNQAPAQNPRALELMQSNTLKKLMDASRSAIEKAVPKHLTADKMISIATTEARKNPALYECDQLSFLGAIIQAAQLGLMPGSVLGQCYLIPYNNTKNGIKEVQFQLGYKGMLDLAGRSPKVSHVYPRAVHEGDEFEFWYGLKEDIRHVPKRGNSQAKLTDVYAVLVLANSNRSFEVMDIEAVEKIKAGSQGARSGKSPWTTHYEAMAKKTVIRQIFKYTPISIEMQIAVALDELNDSDIAQDNSSIIETTGKTVVDKVEELEALLASGPPAAPIKPQEDKVPVNSEPDHDPDSFNNFGRIPE